MRVFAVSDIHGCLTAFETLLKTIELRPEDILITLGDYVDKGPDSKGVLDCLISLHQSYQVISLKGNHEIKMLEARDDDSSKNFWFNFGGKQTLNSYGKSNKKNQFSQIPKVHWNFLEKSCLDYWETDQNLFVHANLDPHLSLEKQSDYELFWKKFCERNPHYSGKTMICGHTSQKSGKPINLGHRVCIDTWACGKGWLTCLEVNSGQMWQANQKGQVKTANIDEFRCSLVDS